MLAAGVGVWLGEVTDIERIGLLLALVLVVMLLPLLFGVYGEPAEIRAPSSHRKYGNAFDDIRYAMTWASLYTFLWLLRRTLFGMALRISLFVLRLSAFLALQTGVFLYYGTVHPFKDQGHIAIELINESIIAALFCLLPAHEDQRTSPDSRQTFGWVTISLIVLLVVINVIYIVVTIRRLFEEREQARRRKAMKYSILNQVTPRQLPVPVKSYNLRLDSIAEQSEETDKLEYK